MYKPKRFKAYELIDKYTYSRLQEGGFGLIDERLLKAIDGLSFSLELTYKKRIRLVCNNWMWHKDSKAADYFQWRGFRNQIYKYYKRSSKHSSIPCQAVDLDSPDLSSKELIQYVLDHQHEGWALDIGAVEVGVNWLHVDVRPRIDGSILEFKS